MHCRWIVLWFYACASLTLRFDISFIFAQHISLALLQPLRWRSVECAMHHQWGVCEA